MSYLVDTHYLIWSLISPEHIPAVHRELLESSESEKFVSNISFWEVSLKYGLGKLRLAGITPEDLVGEATESGFAILGITTEQLAGSHRLEYVGSHRDPFDRLLVWQCITSGMKLMTADEEVQDYAAVGLQLA